MQGNWKAGATVALAAGLVAMAQTETNAAVRTINDPGTGVRWLLERAPAHPAGPGRLVPVGAGNGGAERADAEASNRPAALVIHSGDRVRVEEKTDVVDMCLDAVAQGAAGRGGELTVRLAPSGWLMKVVALAPGRARPAVEARK